MKYKNLLLIKVWLINVAALTILSWTLEPFLLHRLFNNIPEGAGLGIWAFMVIGSSVVYAVVLLFTAILLAIVFKKVLNLKNYILYALLPQFVLAAYAWLGQYHWWPIISSLYIRSGITSLLILVTYFVLFYVKGLIVTKPTK